MSVTKELIEQERLEVQAGRYNELHLHREGTFLRAYDWCAWLGCSYLHDFKVGKRFFKGIAIILSTVCASGYFYLCILCSDVVTM